MNHNFSLEPDTEGMLENVYSLPSQFGMKKFDFLNRVDREFDTVLIGGMGGSAIAGRFAASCFDSLSDLEIRPRNIRIVSDYVIPAKLLDSRTIVILVSYSGNTEEVLELAGLVENSPAYCCAVTTGGKLGDILQDKALFISAGLPPRAALGYIFSGVWSLLGTILNRNEESSCELEAIKSCLRAISDEQRELGFSANNPLVEFAGRMIDGIPVVYAPGSIYNVAAYRWKCQFNENAKHPCFHSVFPEWNHNEIEGWGNSKFGLKPIFLRDYHEHPRNRNRIEIIDSIFSDDGSKPEHVQTREGSFIERLFSMAYIGDLASVYLALLKEVNPTSIERIARLKKDLS